MAKQNWITGLVAKLSRVLCTNSDSGVENLVISDSVEALKRVVCHIFQRAKAKTGESSLEKTFMTAEAVAKETEVLQRWRKQFNEEFRKVYGIEGSEEQCRKKATLVYQRLLDRHDLGPHQNSAGQTITLNFSIDEAIKRYMERQDSELSDNFTSPKGLAYTPDMEKAIFALLTDQDKNFACSQLSLYREIYGEVNVIYREINDRDLYSTNSTSPIRVMGYRDRHGATPNFDPSAAQVSSRTTMGGWGVLRIPITRGKLPLEQLGSLAVFNEYIHSVSRYIAWEPKVKEWSPLINSQEFKTAVADMYGVEVYATLKAIVERITMYGSGKNPLPRAGDGLIVANDPQKSEDNAEMNDAFKILEEESKNFGPGGFDLVKDHVKKSLRSDALQFLTTVRNGRSLRKYVYSMIVNISGDMAESGQYHLYRGVLNPHGPGEDLLKIFDAITDKLVELGDMEVEAAKKEKAAIRENIKSIG